MALTLGGYEVSFNGISRVYDDVTTWAGKTLRGVNPSWVISENPKQTESVFDKITVTIGGYYDSVENFISDALKQSDMQKPIASETPATDAKNQNMVDNAVPIKKIGVMAFALAGIAGVGYFVIKK